MSANVKTNEIAKMIDHTNLKPNMSESELKELCQQAMDHRFFSVCIPPSYVSFARQILSESDVKVCTVIGFPLGYNKKEVKAFETKLAVEEGADEVDMVVNNTLLRDGKNNQFQQDIAAVVEAAGGKTVKVILETSLLKPDQIEVACQLAKKAGAHFVKTSTGYSTEGATVESVALMRKTVGTSLGVKASGGIRNKSQADAMIQAGANRLGCSSGVAIVSKSSDIEPPENY